MHAQPANPNGFDKVINAVGFQKTCNFVLWFILAGALFGFTLARFQYLNFSVFCPSSPGRGGASPGECYWYQFDRYRVGIILHLATILPASLLVVVQFTPFVRHKYRTYHRAAGYLAVLFGYSSIAGVLMISEKSFGGAGATQAFLGTLSIAFLSALALSIYNVRVKQIEQHRAWMIRAWVWAGSIITLRIIMIIAAQVISLYPAARSLYVAYSCEELQYIIGDTKLISRYPTCLPVVDGSNSDGTALQVAVRANFKSGSTEELSAALQVGFSLAGWLALGLHVIGTEIYLTLTPRESRRLRQISYEKQLELGYSQPGSAGTVVERMGDATLWQPDTAVRESGIPPVLRGTEEVGKSRDALGAPIDP